MSKDTLCCGLTMVAVMRSVYSEGGVLIHDVPMLVCPTCHHHHLAPELELDFIMLAHHAETDGVKIASLLEAIGDEKVTRVLNAYPEDERYRTGRRVLPEQVDSLLDMINMAKSLGDDAWYRELLDTLKQFTSWSQVRTR
ncbi:hypothetical protein CIG75_12160 [Tumebacillus algifaecis]|uniref:YgiT-type zinc finger domain-containing protein n=1 Tax=Tumebacillus algifaecis TaxID=1214604 RepID=A0A223D1Q9_9BACL|nr:hypothetical protein [Tumebacillus algifaecis]ASS75669.1 hypothetical protein CIG75_12160 [Tumebacillus algifaecis]